MNVGSLSSLFVEDTVSKHLYSYSLADKLTDGRSCKFFLCLIFHSAKIAVNEKPRRPYKISNTNKFILNLIYAKLLLLLLLLLPSSSSLSSSYPLCRVFILIFLRQIMSLGNTVLQLFCCYYSWCLYR